MLLISCPWCGPRAEVEFRCGGQSHIARPEPSETVSDEDWNSYLFSRLNPKGIHLERWAHIHGCRQWFNVARDTVDHSILAVYRMGESAPEFHP
ncbi:sarcosine oxidase subunit delta [Sphingopyxis terrae]|uniref:sarcosine oxidase subunit delta n=1 Tax=Sphingopyxis terrae TaxID=33052 RepID=UPI002A170607|nr:sarcosine oxidase subunit delta [Sphingopyxis terrae]MDX8356509.1 sarcosine oxidase subunit delta [Sphingopyxis terrae]